MKNEKLIDEVIHEMLEENLVETVTHVVFSEKSLNEMLSDYADEFEVELIEFGRKPSKEDLEEYLNVRILVGPLNNGEEKKKFKLLKSA